MKFFLKAFVVFLSIKSFAAVPIPYDQNSIVDYANANLSQCGTLQKSSDGLVYLKISDRYIDDLYPLLQSTLPDSERSALCKPPYAGKGGVGAHISVIYPAELPTPITSFPEKGRKECFSLSGIAYVEPEQGPFQRVYYVRAISSDLGSLRKNYSLPPQYKNHDFHITIGVIYRPEFGNAPCK